MTRPNTQTSTNIHKHSRDSAHTALDHCCDSRFVEGTVVPSSSCGVDSFLARGGCEGRGVNPNGVRTWVAAVTFAGKSQSPFNRMSDRARRSAAKIREPRTAASYTRLNPQLRLRVLGWP